MGKNSILYRSLNRNHDFGNPHFSSSVMRFCRVWKAKLKKDQEAEGVVDDDAYDGDAYDGDDDDDDDDVDDLIMYACIQGWPKCGACMGLQAFWQCAIHKCQIWICPFTVIETMTIPLKTRSFNSKIVSLYQHLHLMSSTFFSGVHPLLPQTSP